MSAKFDTLGVDGQKKRVQGRKHGKGILCHPSHTTSSTEVARFAGWPAFPLGQIAEVKLGKMLDKRKPQTGRKFPYLRNINVRWGTVDTDDVFEMHFEDAQVERFSLRAGDVLVCEGGEPGRAAVWNGHIPEMKFQKAIHRVRFKVPFEARLLVYLLESLAKSGGLERRFTGSTIKHFTREAFLQLPIPVPPLPEQRRIVAEIEKQFTRLEAGVAALQRVQASLNRYRAAVLKAACEGRLVPTEAELQRTKGRGQQSEVGSRRSEIGGDAELPSETGEALLARILTERGQNWKGRGQYKEPAAPGARNVAPLPEGWIWASVDQLADETMIGLDRGRAQQSADPAKGVPYIKMNNVTMDGRVHCDELVFVPATREEATRFAVQHGDILFNTRNSRELVGKVGLVRNPPAGAIYNNNLMRIRVSTGVSQAFLALQMCSHEFRQRMELVKKATTSVAAVYSKDLLPLAIALPPLAEQTRIVAEVERRLSVVEELESVVSGNLQRAARLRQSILQKAFTGELVAGALG